MSKMPSGPHIEKSGSKMFAGSDRPLMEGTLTVSGGRMSTGDSSVWYWFLSISDQNSARWKASVYWVVPTSTPPKLKSASLKMGDWASSSSGTLSLPAKQLESCAVGFDMALPGAVVMMPVVRSTAVATL